MAWASIRAAMSARRGQAAFDPAADINGDGRVSMLDLTIARRNQGARASIIAIDAVATARAADARR